MQHSTIGWCVSTYFRLICFIIHSTAYRCAESIYNFLVCSLPVGFSKEKEEHNNEKLSGIQKNSQIECLKDRKSKRRNRKTFRRSKYTAANKNLSWSKLRQVPRNKNNHDSEDNPIGDDRRTVDVRSSTCEFKCKLQKAKKVTVTFEFLTNDGFSNAEIYDSPRSNVTTQLPISSQSEFSQDDGQTQYSEDKICLNNANQRENLVQVTQDAQDPTEEGRSDDARDEASKRECPEIAASQYGYFEREVTGGKRVSEEYYSPHIRHSVEVARKDKTFEELEGKIRNVTACKGVSTELKPYKDNTPVENQLEVSAQFEKFSKGEKSNQRPEGPETVENLPNETTFIKEIIRTNFNPDEECFKSEKQATENKAHSVDKNLNAELSVIECKFSNPNDPWNALEVEKNLKNISLGDTRSEKVKYSKIQTDIKHDHNDKCSHVDFYSYKHSDNTEINSQAQITPEDWEINKTKHADVFDKILKGALDKISETGGEAFITTVSAEDAVGKGEIAKDIGTEIHSTEETIAEYRQTKETFVQNHVSEKEVLGDECIKEIAAENPEKTPSNNEYSKYIASECPGQEATVSKGKQNGETAPGSDSITEDDFSEEKTVYIERDPKIKKKNAIENFRSRKSHPERKRDGHTEDVDGNVGCETKRVQKKKVRASKYDAKYNRSVINKNEINCIAHREIKPFQDDITSTKKPLEGKTSSSKLPQHQSQSLGPPSTISNLTRQSQSLGQTGKRAVPLYKQDFQLLKKTPGQNTTLLEAVVKNEPKSPESPIDTTQLSKALQTQSQTSQKQQLIDVLPFSRSWQNMSQYSMQSEQQEPNLLAEPLQEAVAEMLPSSSQEISAMTKMKFNARNSVIGKKTIQFKWSSDDENFVSAWSSDDENFGSAHI